MSRPQIQIGQVGGLWPPTWPMGLTMLRLMLLPAFLWVLLLDADRQQMQEHRYRWVAVGVFAVMAVTDKLDGYLARRLNQTSKVGAVLDPVADKLLIACSVMLLSLDWVAPRGFDLPWEVVVAVYGKDVVIGLGAMALLSFVGKVTVSPRPLGRASTVLQLSLVMATLIGPDLSRIGRGFGYGLTRGLWWAVVMVSVVSCLDYVAEGWRQLRAARG